MEDQKTDSKEEPSNQPGAEADSGEMPPIVFILLGGLVLIIAAAALLN